MPDAQSFDEFYRTTRIRICACIYALTGDLAEASKVVFALPEDLRRRGSRRRAYRAVVATGLAAAVVIVVAVGSTWAIGRNSALPPGQTASPTPSTSAEPSPTKSAETTPAEIPLSAMLDAADVGAGYTASDRQGIDHGSIVMMMSYCGEGDYSAAAEHHVAFRQWSVYQSDQAYVLQDVNRYEATWAARHFSDLRASLPRCQTVDVIGDASHRVTFTLVASNFAGDESLLIEETFGIQTQYHALVRRGDVEAELRIHIGATASEARAIVVNAAQRLCAAVPSC